MQDHIKKAIEILKQGGIVIFPTDTAFGIGCRMDDAQAIEKLFSIRRRPVTQATPVLFSSKNQVKKYATQISQETESFMNEHWPGALTVILPAQIDVVPALVRGGGLTIGTRIPNHKVTLSIIRGVGVPILGPSANFHGDPTPYRFADIHPKLQSLVDYIVPGVCTLKEQSTVVDCSGGTWRILREGAVKLEV